jgi:hypothetical protein
MNTVKKSLLTSLPIRRQGIEVAGSANSFDALSAVIERAELPAEIADVRVDAAVERRKVPP